MQSRHISFSISTHQRGLLANSSDAKSLGADLEKWPEDRIREILSRKAGFPWLDVTPAMVDLKEFDSLQATCRELGFLPAYRSSIAVHVFMPDPFHGPSIRTLRNHFHREIHPIGTPLQSLERVMGRLEASVEMNKGEPVPVVWPDEPDLLSWNYNPDMGVDFVKRVFTLAYRMNTSDVFFETYPDRMDIRFKIANKCTVMPPIAQRHASSVMNDAKAFAGLVMRDTGGYRGGSGETKMPDGNVVGFRAEAQKTIDGESLTLRVLDKRVVMNLSKTLPFPPEYIEPMKRLLTLGQGLILVCGPTGSGKTTTLWRCLLSMNSSELKIATIEDPVEYKIDGFVQLPVKGKTDDDDSPKESFSKAVRSNMRAAPNVILVGEIRDDETANAALEAALTGHLILSTIHTPDTTGAIPRLIDKKQSALNISQTLTAVVAQRLARKLCPECRVPTPPREDQCEHFRFHGITPPENIFSQNGCPKCSEGIVGRLPVFEFLILDSELKNRIRSPFDAEDFRAAWKAKGGRTLGSNAMLLAAQGLISYDEASTLDPEGATRPKKS